MQAKPITFIRKFAQRFVCPLSRVPGHKPFGPRGRAREGETSLAESCSGRDILAIPNKTLLAATLLFLISTGAMAAEPGIAAFTSTPAPGGGQSYSLSLQTLLLLTSLSFLPALLLMMSSFTRIIIVLSLLRSAIGTPSSPPNQVLIGLSLFLTFFVMSPVLEKMYTEAYLPYNEKKISLEQAFNTGMAPLKAFMLRQTRETDLALFLKISNSEPVQSADEVPLKILVPSYVISELKTAFQIGFVVFIPFLIIDMVVASVLMSMGMMMVSPAMISLPFKIMLFVLADGWNLLVGSLVQSFYT
jgi:flagellar biosynthesis protein FliP